MSKAEIIRYVRGMLKQLVKSKRLANACSLAMMLVSASWLATTPAKAQTQLPEIVLTDKGGCKLYHPAFPALVDAQVLNVMGSCMNGFFQGAVLYGVSWKVKAGNEPAKEVIGMRIGMMQHGRFDGLRMLIDQGGRLFLSPPDRSIAFRTVREQPEYNLPQLLNAISTEAIKAGGQYASANRDYLTTVAKIWDKKTLTA